MQWMGLTEGQIIKVHRNEEVPADIVILLTSVEDGGLIHLDTINLDGESNLKEKYALYKQVPNPHNNDQQEGENVADKEDLIVSRIFSRANNPSYEDIQLRFNGAVQCTQPNENLEHWDGILNFKCDEALQTKSADIRNLILRSSIIRNTEYAIGIVVYSGMNTKIMKNLKKIPRKVSNVMDLMNKMLYTVLLFQVVLVFLIAGLSLNWDDQFYTKHHFYLNLKVNYSAAEEDDKEATYAKQFFIQVLIYWVAYSHMIPISLYVVIEVLKLGLASYINRDTALLVSNSKNTTKHFPSLFKLLSGQQNPSPPPDTNLSIKKPFKQCKNSDLIEELGQIQIIFCDKTGTLTANKMILKKFQINGIKYGDEHDYSGQSAQQLDKDSGRLPERCRNEIHNTIRTEEVEQSEEGGERGHVTSFFEALALCNTVIVEQNLGNQGVEYNSVSPDEIALVNGAKENAGIQLIEKNNHKKEVKIYNQVTKTNSTFKIIAEFPFDSDRKRMSIVLKCQKTQKIIMMTKGADTFMIKRLDFQKNDFEELRELLEEDISQYSKEGLRTIIIAQKVLTEKEYQQLKSDIKNQQGLLGTEKEMRWTEIYNKYEKNLKYLGVTAVEDKLQEGVPATIATLLKSEIRFFILTGDKIESTIQTANAANVIQDHMQVILIQTNDRYVLDRCLTKLTENFKMNLESHHIDLEELEVEERVVAVDGPTLAIIQSDIDLEHMFYHVAIRSRSVLFCRLSPKQKADIVRIFKTRGDWVTLAIGDGANDVSMILEANIGIGIKGSEGTQAIRQADFAIEHFQQILRLLLFQGRSSYARISQMICFYFYKNVILVFAEFYFAIFSGFSGQNFFPDWLPMLYNALFSSWHCLIAMLLEKDVNDHLSFKHAQIYRAGQLGKSFNFLVFWKWMFLAIIHGALCFFLPIMSGAKTLDETGQTGEHWHLSTLSFTLIIHLVFYKLLIETRHFNAYNFISGVLSLLIYYNVLYYLSEVPLISKTLQPEIEGFMCRLFQTQNFWALLFVIPLACLIPDLILKLVQQVFFPSPIDKVLMQASQKAKISISQPSSFNAANDQEFPPIEAQSENSRHSDQVLNQQVDPSEKLNEAVGRGLKHNLMHQYDFSVDFENLSQKIERNKTAQAMSNAQRKELIQAFIKKKLDQELMSGAGSQPYESSQFNLNSKGAIALNNPDIKSCNSKLVTFPRSDDNFEVRIKFLENNFHNFGPKRQLTMKDSKKSKKGHRKPGSLNNHIQLSIEKNQIICNSNNDSSSLSSSHADLDVLKKQKNAHSMSLLNKLDSQADFDPNKHNLYSNEQGQDNEGESNYEEDLNHTMRSSKALLQVTKNTNYKPHHHRGDSQGFTRPSKRDGDLQVGQGEQRYSLFKKLRRGAQDGRKAGGQEIHAIVQKHESHGLTSEKESENEVVSPEMTQQQASKEQQIPIELTQDVVNQNELVRKFTNQTYNKDRQNWEEENISPFRENQQICNESEYNQFSIQKIQEVKEENSLQNSGSTVDNYIPSTSILPQLENTDSNICMHKNFQSGVVPQLNYVNQKEKDIMKLKKHDSQLDHLRQPKNYVRDDQLSQPPAINLDQESRDYIQEEFLLIDSFQDLSDVEVNAQTTAHHKQLGAKKLSQKALNQLSKM